MIDVGTDHGMIPIRLAQSDYTGNIFASDIVSGPLNVAMEAARACSQEHRIRFLLCDGLDLCPPEEVDCILIAGMGGDSICGILDRAEWLFSAPYTLILQPMTKAEVVRYWLVHNEFQIDREAVVSEEGHIYQVFSAIPGKNPRMTDAEYLIGRRDTFRFGEPVELLIRHQLEQTEKKINGLSSAGYTNSSEYFFFKQVLDQLRIMIQE